MKKLFVLFSFIFISPAFADIVTDFTNSCGNVGYDRIYAIFSPQSITCESGYFLPVNSLTCAICPDGYICNGGTFEFDTINAQGLTRNQSYITASVLRNACAPRIASRRMYAIFTKPTTTCASGYFLPADSLTCQPCPVGFTCNGGTFERDIINAQGITRNENYASGIMQNACAANTTFNRVYAIFKPKTFTCVSGYFLPANASECVPCPSGYVCSGGTFEHNTTSAQGIIENTTQEDLLISAHNTCSDNLTSHVLNGFFVPNVHDCAPGYYLPANIDECTLCPANNKCVGGTYTFNETTTQGIEQCNVNTYAPSGADKCYDHILHIGTDNIYRNNTKQTRPALHIGLNGNIYYANMILDPICVNKDSSHQFKIKYDNKIYYVCDDTICRQ